MRSRFLMTTAVLLSLAPVGVAAQTTGVPELLRQAQYWEGRGRRDLANQAYRRVLAIDPANATARRGVAGSPQAQPKRAPAPRAAPAPVPQASEAPRRTPSPAPAPRRADPGGDARAAGFAALEAGNLDRAETRFREALRRSSNDADALGGLGIVELRRERFAEARDLLQRASARGNRGRWAEALQSASFFADLRAAEADLQAGRIAEAETAAERLARGNSPQAREAMPLLAEIYQTQGRFADAAALYTQAARNDGGANAGKLRVSAIRAQAQAAVAAGQVGEVPRLYDRALSLDPNDPWLRYDYARFLRDQRRPMDASTIIDPLAQSALPEARYAAALYAEQSGQTARAESLMARIPDGQRTAEMNGFLVGLRADVAIERARALAGQGQQAVAAQSLRGIAETPGLPAPQLANIAAAMLEMNDTQSAAILAERAANMPVDSAEAYEPIVRVLAATGQDMAAESAIQRAGQLAGGATATASLRSTLAVARADRLRLNGQYAAAFDVLQQGWAATPGDQEILMSLARLYQTGNLNSQAAQTYRMILAKDPNDRDALIGFAETASAAGEHAAARDAVRQAIRAAPDDYRTYLAAARVEQARGDDRSARKYLDEARRRYLAQNGGNAANPFGGNPFAQATPVMASNPFAPVPASNNPFALTQDRGMAPITAQTPAPGMSFGSTSPGGFDTPQTGGFAGQAMQPGGSPVVSGDPVLAGIEADLRRLTNDRGPRADVTTGYRDRSGEAGLSTLKELTGTAKLSTGVGPGRLGVQVQAVVLDAGRPSASGTARFGRNGTEEAQAIVDERPATLAPVGTQSDAGVAIAATYESELVKADFGTTPLGFTRRNATGGISVTPRLSPNASARLWAEHRPVTDSVLSYAGTRDPVTGEFWGAVMRSGGGASLSWDREGNGAYADGSWYDYDGTGVRSNQSVEFNAGGYARAWSDAKSSLTFGINANYQSYANNQNYFSYGHGGYFSPQSFFSVSFPVRYQVTTDALELRANVAPGYQSFRQEDVPLFPTDPAAQGVLDGLKAQNVDVRSRYDALSETGFGLAAGASAYYSLTGNTRVGGDLNVNTFGQYNEVRTSIGIKQGLGGDR